MRDFIRTLLLFFFFFQSLSGQERLEDCLDDPLVGYQAPAEEAAMGEVFLAADCEPLATVAGCVNISSGHFFQADEDLRGQTIDPLVVKRFYDSHSQCQTFMGVGFGCQFPLMASSVEKSRKHSYGFISERDGFLVPCRGDLEAVHQMRRYAIDPRLLEKGYTNAGRPKTSGQDNLVNWRGIYKRHAKDARFWTVRQGDGSMRLYGKKIELSEKSREEMGFPTNEAYLLTEQTKANGNRLLFDYDMIAGKPHLSSVKTLSRVGDVLLNELSLKHYKNGCVIASSCGRQVAYDKEDHKKNAQRFSKKFLTRSVSSGHGAVVYVREKEGKAPKIVRVEKPDGRVLAIKYDKEQAVKLEAPVGEQGELVPLYRFAYAKNKTKVWNALNQLTVYVFDDNNRPRLIEERDENQKALRQKCFEWSARAGQQGWLRAKSLGVGKELLYRKTYRYDERGNVLRETLYGNLTGEKSPVFTLEESLQTDRLVTNYVYSKDGRNLLLSKEKAEGLTIEYGYLPGTNLCAHEFHHYQGQIQERLFKFYDGNGELSMLIEDDGCGATVEDLTNLTFRRYKSIVADKQIGSVSFGKPIEIIESYRHQDTGALIAINRATIAYDAHGNESVRRLYDSQGTLHKEWTKAYDKRQRLIKESDAIGQSTKYAYDKNNNKISQTQGKLSIAYAYDAGDRLVSKTEKSADGQTFTTCYRYNALSQLVKEIDPDGNETSYVYDRLGRQTVCVKPAMQDGAGAIVCPTTTGRYNAWDQLVEETDERGFVTKRAYNSYGKPTLIVYPDQAVERLTYYPWGWLKSRQFADGISVCYEYDSKGRALKETTLQANGQVLKTESCHYKGALLQSKIDANGVQTRYAYDGAGRKVQEIVGYHARFIAYAYDDLGRVSGEFQAIDSQNGRWIRYQYDGLDRVVVKEFEDAFGQKSGKETFAYDRRGHLVSHGVWQTNDQAATSQALYNALGDVLWKKDPLGHQTTWSYNYRFVNGLGQQVELRTIQDPLGRKTQEADDAFGRLIRKIVYGDEQESSRTDYVYNGLGQLIKELSTVYANGAPIREYGVEKAYDSRGRLSVETELPSGKTLRFVYDGRGRLTQKIKPDGVALNYSYDALGRLSQLTSTDGTLNYIYAHDLNDNIVSIVDRVHSIAQNRAFDSLNRLIKEELNAGVTIHYQYDGLSRLTRLTLPDGSWISYIYDAFHLKRAQRYNAMGALQYACECPAYTLDGKSLTIDSPAGPVHYAYDLSGRAVSVKCAAWQTQSQAFDAAGNLVAREQTDPSGTSQETLAYDRFNHLTVESGVANAYQYDSLGNCLAKNGQPRAINALNQVTDDSDCRYSYDANGNLLTQSQPLATNGYDAYNRLIHCQTETDTLSFVYDTFGRCLEIRDAQGARKLIYQGEKEIGSLLNGQIDELRVMHPSKETVFSVELQQNVFFPIQDERWNICALRRADGSLAQWTRYGAFGKSLQAGDARLRNPWGFANRREVASLVLFLHRFYNPKLMRWQTADPLGFADGLNQYAYAHNNPFRYRDLDGRFAWALSFAFLEGSFGCAGLAIACPLLIPACAITAGVTLACAAVYYAQDYRLRSAMLANNHEENGALTATKDPTPASTKKKPRYREENYPGTDKDLENHPDWEEATYPKQREAGHREFKNEKTEEELRYDKGKPGETGHKAEDHYHRYNPKRTNDNDRYLDQNGNPIHKNDDRSHLYPPEGVKWDFN